MAKLDAAILDSLISDQVGPHASWHNVIGDFLTPMSVTIEEVTRDLPKEVIVYWVNGGLPENFSLPGLDPAPIVFNTRFIEIGATMLRMIRAKEFAIELLPAVAERISLQVSAELVLKGGDAATASYLFARSLVVGGGTVILPSTVDSLEYDKKNESYMTVWFYALLHEIGHVYVEIRDGDERVISEETLQQRTEEALEEFRYPPDLVDRLNRWLESRGIRHSLHPDQLEAETAADLFAVRSLWRATHAVMEKDGQAAKFNPARLGLCIIEMFNVLAMLNNCALTTRGVTDSAVDMRDEPWINVANRIRAGILVQYMSMLLAGGPDDLEAVSRWENVFVAWSQENKDRLDAMESGQARAMRQILWPAERDSDIGDRLCHLTDIPDTLAKIELRRFIALADALAISHPDLELLRAISDQAPLRPMQRKYHILWIRRANGSSFPFGLASKYGYLVFVFTARTPLYQYFRDESATGLAADFSLHEVTLAEEWEWDVITICVRAVPPELRERARIVIEGSPLFDRLMKEVASGSVWPDAP